jgi:hypothetical protein
MQLVGVMKSTKEVIDVALLASGQFTRPSPVCPDVAMFSGLDAGEGKDANDTEDILKEKKMLKRLSLKRGPARAAPVKMSVRTLVKTL